MAREYTEDIQKILKVAYESTEKHEIIQALDDSGVGYGKLVNLYSLCMRLSQAIRQARNFQKTT